MEHAERLTRVIGIVVATALVGAFFSVCVGLFLATKQYRTELRRDEVARLTRQINLLILLRDELTHIQTGIDRGTFQVKLEGQVLKSSGYQWPTQIWSNLKWNAEVLNVEPSLVLVLANTYNEITHAEQLRDNLAEAKGGLLTNFVRQMFLTMGALESDLVNANPANPQFDINMKTYAELQERIQQQLPPTIAAVEIKINELRAQVGR